MLDLYWGFKSKLDSILKNVLLAHNSKAFILQQVKLDHQGLFGV